MVVYHAADAQSGDTTPLSDDEVDRIFRALADATRRDIVRRTLTEAISVSVLAEDYDMSFAAVQKHVSVLESAGLVNKNRKGRERLVSGNPEKIRQVQSLLDRYELLWRQRIDRLDTLLAEESRPPRPEDPR
jgi:DNA-binding transcriptional ArsR family regulator